eukprot:12335658-Heterocapsa_arctica.AAC.1
MEDSIHQHPVFGAWLERMDTEQNAVGKDAQPTQGLVERHIDLIKIIMHEILTESIWHDIEITFVEVTICGNDTKDEMLEIGSFSPYQHAYGCHPLQLNDMQNMPPMSMTGLADHLMGDNFECLSNIQSPAKSAHIDAPMYTRCHIAVNYPRRCFAADDFKAGNEC